MLQKRKKKVSMMKKEIENIKKNQMKFSEFKYNTRNEKANKYWKELSADYTTEIKINEILYIAIEIIQKKAYRKKRLNWMMGTFYIIVRDKIRMSRKKKYGVIKIFD